MTDDAPVRCPWCGTDPLYTAYHDTEWGVAERDSRALFEKLVLDGFQAGLSWITILRKRDNFRRAFDGFDPERLARWTEADVARALADPGIVRHRGKIEEAVGNARAFLAVEDRESFSDFLWRFTGGEPIVNRFATQSDVPPDTTSMPAPRSPSSLSTARFEFALTAKQIRWSVQSSACRNIRKCRVSVAAE